VSLEGTDRIQFAMFYQSLIAALLALTAAILLGRHKLKKFASFVKIQKWVKKYLADNYHNDSQLAKKLKKYLSREDAESLVTKQFVDLRVKELLGDRLFTPEKAQGIADNLEASIDRRIGDQLAIRAQVDPNLAKQVQRLETGIKTLLAYLKPLNTASLESLRSPIQAEIHQIEARKNEGRGQLLVDLRSAETEKSEKEREHRRLSHERMPERPTPAMIQKHVESLGLPEDAYAQRGQAAEEYNAGYRGQRIDHAESVDRAQTAAQDAKAALEAARQRLSDFDREHSNPDDDARLKVLNASLARINGLTTALEQAEVALRPSLPAPAPLPQMAPARPQPGPAEVSAPPPLTRREGGPAIPPPLPPQPAQPAQPAEPEQDDDDGDDAMTVNLSEFPPPPGLADVPSGGPLSVDDDTKGKKKAKKKRKKVQKKQLVCPHCNFALPGGSSFCAQCGEALTS